MLEQAVRPGRDEAEVDQIMAEHAAERAPRGAGADARLAVQGKGDLGGEVHGAAARGVDGPGGALPFQDQIQRSFGQYDISGVQAHTGGAADQACDAIGARAYATGDQVAFKGTPDLHTAAHEAAHVVQQRAGVHLAGGVGREGDPYERHADRVADAVVAGEPADYLLGQMAGPTAAAKGGAVQMKKDLPKGEEGFAKMWEAHPHNDGYGGEEDTSSSEVREEHGLPDYIDNTCAVRLSVMLNGIGETITPAKTKAAGIERKPHYSSKTKQYYILAAKEMWTYLTKYYRAPDVAFPPAGKRFKDEEEFQDAFEKDVKPLLAGRKGIVAFDKIFGYGGTGHVDLFDGEALSDSSGWYSSQRLMLWYVAVP
ncbi:MAG: T6SS effector amidase Tae4 family protein [Kofleriaceae bacterium]